MVLGFGKKDAGIVGCYGKLPSQGDYISHQVDGEARHLTKWLDSGYRLDGAKDELEGESTKFLLAPGGRRSLAGTIWPSADASGTRRFPFSMFTEVRARHVAPLGSRIPLALNPLWRKMALAMPEVRVATSLDGISGCLSKMQVPEIPEADPLGNEFRTRAAESQNAWNGVAVLLDLHRLIAALSERKETPAFAAWIPLRTRYAPELEATGWLSLLGRGIGERCIGESHLFVRAARAGGPGALFVIHRELRNEDLRFVLTPNSDYPYANLIEAPADDEELHSFQDRIRAKAGPSPTLRDLMEISP